MSKKLKKYTDEELTAELLRRNPPPMFPSASVTMHNVWEVTLPVGKDHHATLVFHREDLAELLKRAK